MKGSLYFAKSWMVVAGSLWDSRVVRITGAPTLPTCPPCPPADFPKTVNRGWLQAAALVWRDQNLVRQFLSRTLKGGVASETNITLK